MHVYIFIYIFFAIHRLLYSSFLCFTLYYIWSMCFQKQFNLLGGFFLKKIVLNSNGKNGSKINNKRMKNENFFVKNSSCDCKGLWIHDHLVGKQTSNCSAKLTNWVSCYVKAYLYGVLNVYFFKSKFRDSKFMPSFI